MKVALNQQENKNEDILKIEKELINPLEEDIMDITFS